MKSAPPSFKSSTALRPSAAVRHRDGRWKMWRSAVDHRPGDHHARPQNRPCIDLFTPLQQLMQITAHVANPGYSVGDEQRQNDFFATRQPVAKIGVNVHIPKARDEKLSPPIDDLRTFQICGG